MQHKLKPGIGFAEVVQPRGEFEVLGEFEGQSTGRGEASVRLFTPLLWSRRVISLRIITDASFSSVNSSSKS